MRIAHLADTHLGVRQYLRVTRSGANQREADVAASFTAAVTGVIAARPDLVVVAGDVFDRIHPSNASVTVAVTEFQRLVQALPETPVVVVGGNHDIPNSTETACALRALEPLGVHVVWERAERLRLGDVAILCVPERRGLVRPALTPDADARWNVLLLHGEIRGAIPGARDTEDAYDAAELGAAWNYVALGHYHVHHEVAPRAWYAGALDYVSSNPWGELKDEAARGVPGKGWVLHDCATGVHTFVPTPALRPWVDVPAIEGAGLLASEIDAAIAAAVAAIPGGPTNKMVRLTVRDVPRDVKAELDHQRLRRWKSDAVHFDAGVFPPALGTRVGGVGRLGLKSLEEMLGDHILRCATESGVDLEQLLALGQRYLAEATELTPPSAADVGVAA